jgi:tRNA(adenine34) deaminase
MRAALAEASAAEATGDVPVGAVILDPSGTVLARGRNRREADSDPTAHAEIVAIRSAARAAGGWHLDGMTLVVTLEPCMMCAGAVVASRLGRLVFGAADPRAGAVGSVWDLVRDQRLAPCPEVIGGVLAAESLQIIRTFFSARRDLPRQSFWVSCAAYTASTREILGLSELFLGTTSDPDALLVVNVR